MISIHALVKRATPLSTRGSDTQGISIHALVKRATSKTIRQPTRQEISIHALVKRATGYSPPSKFLLLISIHALVKRATRTPASSICTKFYFNPRPREEGDMLSESPGSKLSISIHALVKRATCYRKAQARNYLFQSTPS